MSETLTLQVICHSIIKQALERDQLTVELPRGSIGSDLEKHIRDLAGGQLEGVPLRLAVNREFVSNDTELIDGDEVVIIPPVQGG